VKDGGLQILNAEPEDYSDVARSILLGLGHLHEESCTESRLKNILGGFDVLIARFRHRLDGEALEGAAHLKVIVSPTTGLDHIDLTAADRRGIAVLSLQGERAFLRSITATAELTWGLLLALCRRFNEVRDHVREGGWDRDALKGSELKGKVLGIIGLGRLGSMVAGYGRAFRMKVIAHDPRCPKAPSWVDLVSIEEAAARSDVISVHVPLTKSTSGLFGRELFGKMKRGVLFINTSRGDVVNERALCAALESGRVKGAAVDVLGGEASRDRGWLGKSPLWRYARDNPNVIITPHLGGATLESMQAVEVFMAKKLRTFWKSNRRLFEGQNAGGVP
jgi:D-3-phosphoglycerate dehydrogenase